jgi:hypothetical protein
MGSVIYAPDIRYGSFSAAAGAAPLTSSLQTPAAPAPAHAPVRALRASNRTDYKDEDLIVQHYDHSGALRWTMRGGGLGSDVGQGISVSVRERAVFVCGYTTSAVAYFGDFAVTTRGGVDGFLVKLDAATGPLARPLLCSAFPLTPRFVCV